MVTQNTAGTVGQSIADTNERHNLVADLIKELSDLRALDHLDGYGGALFALDVDEALKALETKGWRFSTREERRGD